MSVYEHLCEIWRFKSESLIFGVKWVNLFELSIKPIRFAHFLFQSGLFLLITWNKVVECSNNSWQIYLNATEPVPLYLHRRGGVDHPAGKDEQLISIWKTQFKVLVVYHIWRGRLHCQINNKNLNFGCKFYLWQPKRSKSVPLHPALPYHFCQYLVLKKSTSLSFLYICWKFSLFKYVGSVYMSNRSM